MRGSSWLRLSEDLKRRLGKAQLEETLTRSLGLSRGVLWSAAQSLVSQLAWRPFAALKMGGLRYPTAPFDEQITDLQLPIPHLTLFTHNLNHHPRLSFCRFYLSQAVLSATVHLHPYTQYACEGRACDPFGSMPRLDKVKLQTLLMDTGF